MVGQWIAAIVNIGLEISVVNLMND